MLFLQLRKLNMMIKKLLSFFAITIFAAGIASAQSFTITSAQTTYTGDPASAIDAYMQVVNTSSTMKYVIAKRQIVTLASGQFNNFCWGPSCYGPGTDVATDTVLLGAGVTDNSFKGTISPYNNVGVSIVEYTVYDLNNPNDKASITITYDVNSTGINESVKAKIFSQGYPNPADRAVAFRFDAVGMSFDAKLVVRNILGSIVKEQPLTERSGVVVIPTWAFDAGFYFVSLVDGNKPIVTRKIVVAHKRAN